MDLNGAADAYMFWCCSDLFEEQFMLPKPFVGSFGIVSNDGIPKPNFWGFKILSQLFPKRLKTPFRTNDAVEYAAFVDGDRTQVLLYTQNQDYFCDDRFEIDVEVNNVANKVSSCCIDDTHCNPKAEWMKLGLPDNLTSEQAMEIRKKTSLKEEAVEFKVTDSETKVKVSMGTNEVVLLTFEA